MSIEMIEEQEFNQGTLIKVIGVGGGGGNAVEHMIASGVQGAEFLCANTDAQALSASHADRVIQLGITGLGAGSKPEMGREAAAGAEDQIRAAIEGADMLFITAGMGGGTGTGAAPVIARIAREMRILTVGVVTKPFDFEGKHRMANAEAGLAELEANLDSLIVILNDKLLDVLGDEVTQEQAFAHANDVLKNAVGGIAEIIKVKAEVNVDFEDVRTVMGEQGKAMMGTGVANGPDRARIAAEQAVACPLLEGIDLAGAKALLVLISASRSSLKLKETKLAMETIKASSGADAHVIFGTAYDENLGEDIRVTVVATGLMRTGMRRNVPPMVVLRTGTDNQPIGMPTVNSAIGGPGALGAGQPSMASPGLSSAPDYGQLPPNAPRVWHSNRQTAAARVDALSSSGMDDIEIPAFLRKQAD